LESNPKTRVNVDSISELITNQISMQISLNAFIRTTDQTDGVTNLHSLYLSRSDEHTLTFTHSLSNAHTHFLSHTHTHSLSHTQITHYLSLSHTHTLSHSHSLSHTQTQDMFFVYIYSTMVRTERLAI